MLHLLRVKSFYPLSFLSSSSRRPACSDVCTSCWLIGYMHVKTAWWCISWKCNRSMDVWTELCTTMRFLWSSNTIIIVNDCPHTIWPQFKFAEINITITEFELSRGRTRSVNIKAPTDLDAFLVGRTDCQINNRSRKLSCNTIYKPVTLVVFKFRANGDKYYVDNVDGFNLPVSVDAIGGSGSAMYNCAKAGCIGHMTGWCPPELRVQGRDGCHSACNVFHSPEYCCSQQFSTPSTCKPTSYTKAFQRVCPRSRTLPYNIDTTTNIFTCQGADYIVRFCPAAGTFSTIQHGGQLRSTDRLTSSNGTFTLGFYGVNYGSLGIWYSNDERKMVWVADRHEPIISTSGNHALSVDPNTGKLIIIAGGTTLRVIADVQSGPNPNVVATLGDDGRLRLTANGAVLWQTPFHPFIPHGKTHLWAVAVGVAVGVAGGAVLLVIILSYKLFCKKNNIRQKGEESEVIEETAEIEMSDSMKDKVLMLSNFRIFDHESILLATNHYSEENKLGRGGFGPVYKGMLDDGEEIAVKKLEQTSQQGSQEFEAEIKAIANLKHTSLVQVRGCCVHGGDYMLVYEYMHNKGLDYHLYNEERRRALEWPSRKSIIQAIAKGLQYLHMDLNMQVIHRDLKPSNILLDQNMNAKISDFGLARFLSPGEDIAPAGTVGYMAPDVKASTQSDLYSFGVIMLEIVSGIRVVSSSFPDTDQGLVGYAWHLWKRDEKMKLKDPLLPDDDRVDNEVSRIIDTSLLCIQKEPDVRQPTSTICELLTSVTPVPEPVLPLYFKDTTAPTASLPDLIANNRKILIPGFDTVQDTDIGDIDMGLDIEHDIEIGD